MSEDEKKAPTYPLVPQEDFWRLSLYLEWLFSWPCFNLFGCGTFWYILFHFYQISEEDNYGLSGEVHINKKADKSFFSLDQNSDVRGFVDGKNLRRVALFGYTLDI